MSNPSKVPSVLSGRAALIVGEICVFLVLWALTPVSAFPSITDVWTAWLMLWNQGLAVELARSVATNAEAISVASLIALVLAYSVRLPMVGRYMEPVVTFIAKLRFLSLGCMTVFFAQIFTGSPHQLKVSILVFSVVVFFVTSMLDVIVSIPKEEFDLARTLKFGPLRVVWEVIVLGQIDKAFDVLRQNAAISWMMLTLVEGIVFSEGGIGAVLQTQAHHFRLEAIVAIQITILVVGLLQDRALGLLKSLVCPYAELGVEKR